MVPKVVLQLVDHYRVILPLKIILEALDVPSSTYHRWRKQSPPRSELTKNEEAVITLCKDTKLLNGYRKITALLRRDMKISHNTVQKIMQRHNLNCRVKVKRYRKTRQQAYISNNLLKRDFKTTRPLEKLVTDITYLPFGPNVFVHYHGLFQW